MSPALDYCTNPSHSLSKGLHRHDGSDIQSDDYVYYNPRLDPANFLEGPLSINPATRLRQMLARPGIVVRLCRLFKNMVLISFRSLLVSVMGSVRDARWKPVSIACTKGQCIHYR